MNNYVLIRRDRNRHGGGVAVYVSNRFDYKRRDDLNKSNLECLWFESHYPNKSPVLVGEFYSILKCLRRYIVLFNASKV